MRWVDRKCGRSGWSFDRRTRRPGDKEKGIVMALRLLISPSPCPPSPRSGRRRTMLRQRELDELFAELEEAQDGLLDATLDDERATEPLSLMADEAELAGGFRAKLAITPRPYQSDALAAWLAADSRGVVVLPTGAGKTILAL